MNKTPLGLLGGDVISAVFDCADTDTKLRLAGTSLCISALLSDRVYKVVSTCRSTAEACELGSLILTRYMPPILQDHANECFERACCGGYRDIAEHFLNRGYTDDLESGMRGASVSGHIDIAEKMLAKGATNAEECLLWACYRGHCDIAVLMILNGAQNLNEGLAKACFAGYTCMAETMIEFGADDISRGLCCANAGGRTGTAQMLIARGAVLATHEGHNHDFGMEDRYAPVGRLGPDFDDHSDDYGEDVYFE